MTRPRGARRLPAAASFLALALALIPACEPARDATAPTAAADPAIPPTDDGRAANLLLVTIDTLRADRVGSYGHVRATTPHLDALARGGVLFEQAYTVSPTTLPAHASLFTGQPPSVHRVHQNGSVLADEATTLAEHLAGAGYQNGAFVSSFVVDRRFGLAQGFEHFDDNFVRNDAQVAPGTEWNGQRIPLAFDRIGAATVDRALAWLARRRPERPVFLWVHLFDPHQPLVPKEPFASEFARGEVDPVERLQDAYDAEVRYADEQLGRLIEAFEAHAAGTPPLIAVTSDHGEGLWDHGWLEHGALLYDEAVRIPMVLNRPGHLPAGLRIAPPVSLMDLGPTLLELAGLPGYHGIQGQSLVPLMDDNTASVRDNVLIEDDLDIPAGHVALATSIRTLITPTHRYTRYNTGEDGLYELHTDDDERTNLSSTEPALRAEHVEQLTDALIAHTEKSRHAPLVGATTGGV